MEFKSSEPLTIGIELELQLVRPHDLDLARGATDLLARLARRRLPGAVKPEITESMIELNSSAHRPEHGGAPALLAELEAMRLSARGDGADLRAGGGAGAACHRVH